MYKLGDLTLHKSHRHHRPRLIYLRPLLLLILLLLYGCSDALITKVGPDFTQPDPHLSSRWNTPEPILKDTSARILQHISRTKNWWKRFNDKDLIYLINAAQRASPGVAEAQARVAAARAEMTSAIAQGLPSIGSQSFIVRARTTFGTPPFDWTRYQTGIQSNWELDLFGGIAREQEAAASHLSAQENSVRAAQVALAVEVANAYMEYRYCTLLVRRTNEILDIRRSIVVNEKKIVDSGLKSSEFIIPASVSESESMEDLIRRKSECDRSIKVLVALSGLSEAKVAFRLSKQNNPVPPRPPEFRLEAFPAKTLLQRPDVAAAELQVAVASARIGVAEAKRYPKLTISGNIAPTLQTVSGMSAFYPYMAAAGGSSTYLANTWSIGPTLNLPLFDAGRRLADVDSSIQEYESAKTKFQATCRTAAKEVEIALLRINASEKMREQAKTRINAYQKKITALQIRNDAGFAGRVELEQSQVLVLKEEVALSEIDLEQTLAWIALYRAAGGDWDDSLVQS